MFVDFATISECRHPRCLEPREGWNTSIYAIVGTDNLVRYVGKTAKPLAARFDEHIAKPVNKDMHLWLVRSITRRQMPRIELLTMAPDDNWGPSERAWISWFQVRGRLLNRDAGGSLRGPGGRLTPTGRRITDFHRKAIKSGRSRFIMR